MPPILIGLVFEEDPTLTLLQVPNRSELHFDQDVLLGVHLLLFRYSFRSPLHEILGPLNCRFG